ncbi:MAG: hypothetical protein JW937_03925, partial [Candidatus Omnitrophica bacterium]|nr:hypothetical protein [Candidatus Omnitrophota bacterium]
PVNALQKWDELGRLGRVVGIGGNDAHGKVGWAGLKLDPYTMTLSLVQNHVLAENLTEAAILEGIRAGRTYVVFGRRGVPKGFAFWVQDQQGTQTWIMGEELEFQEGLFIEVRLPRGGVGELIKDGELLETLTGISESYLVTEPGIYRVEVTRDGKPWVYSNPVYIR